MRIKKQTKIQIKKWDIIIIGVLLISSFLPYMVLKEFIVQAGSQRYAYISIDRKPYKEIPLTGQVSHQEEWIETEYGRNKIAIENESIAVIESDCHDHRCEEFGYISKPGENISCLPHHLYIEVRGKQNPSENNIDAIAR